MGQIIQYYYRVTVVTIYLIVMRSPAHGDSSQDVIQAQGLAQKKDWGQTLICDFN